MSPIRNQRALLAAYRTNMATYVSSLQPSRVRFFYATGDDSQPRITKGLSILDLDGVRYYVSCAETSGSTYTYLEGSLRNLLDAPVSSIQPHDNPDTIHYGELSGGDRDDDIQTGNHLTTSLALYRTTGCTLNSHINHYLYNDAMGRFAMQGRIECNTPLVHPLPKDANCYDVSGSVKGTLHAAYLPQYPTISRLLQHYAEVYVVGSAMEGGAHTIHNGRRYWVHTGARGGRYIQLGPKKRHYLRPYRHKGGGEPLAYKTATFDDGFVDFLARACMIPIAEMREDLSDVRVFYDEYGDLVAHGPEHIVFQYDFRAGVMQIFYVDAQKAIIAYYADKTAPTVLTPYERQCLQEFRQSAMAFRPVFVDA